MVYLSYYEEYPIYEPAEGGYYYSGAELVESERLSRRQAKKQLKELVEEAYAIDEHDFRYNGEWVYDGHWMLREKTKYIGDGRFYCIEKKQGSHTRGYVPYE